MTASETPGRMALTHHLRRFGVTHVVFHHAQVVDPDFDLGAYARGILAVMDRRKLTQMDALVPWGTESWTVPLTLPFLDETGEKFNAWLRYRLNEARARTVTPI